MINIYYFHKKGKHLYYDEFARYSFGKERKGIFCGKYLLVYGKRVRIDFIVNIYYFGKEVNVIFSVQCLLFWRRWLHFVVNIYYFVKEGKAYIFLFNI